MNEGPPLRVPDRHIRRSGLRPQVVFGQFPLALTVLVIALSAPAFHPELLQSTLFELSLLFHAVLLILCFIVPWDRFRPEIFLVIPVMDFFAIALTRTAAAEILPGLGLLAVFPVIWLSASTLIPRTSVLISFLGPLMVVLPTALLSAEITPGDLTSVLLLPVTTLAISLAIHSLSASTELQRRKLEEKEGKLQALFSESNQRERLLSTILDTIDVGLIAVDAKGERVLTNRHQQFFDELARPDPEAEACEGDLLVFGRDKHTALAPERHPVRRAVEGDTFSDYVVWLGAGRGQRAVSVTARAMTDSNANFLGSVIVFSDVTELVEAVSVKDDFVANVSHEFRSPLTSILGNLDMILDDNHESPPHIKQHLGIISRNTERLLALVSDLLMTAAASTEVHPRPTNLAALVETSLDSAWSQARNAQLALVKEVPDPFWTYVDPLRMGQVLDNLVSNAIKYSPDGGTITVRACQEDNRILLEVADTGMGMSQREADQAFSRFFRSGAARASAAPGVGLGLSITRTIVENHGGTISCTSETGFGTTFTIALPGRTPAVEQS